MITVRYVGYTMVRDYYEILGVARDATDEQIKKALPITFMIMPVDEALAQGAIGLFTDKYDDKVKVFTAGHDNDIFSREICGGPHVDNTAELGHFKITKEESSSAGVRRIKAVLAANSSTFLLAKHIDYC